MQNLKKSIPVTVTEVDLVYRNQTNPEECATVTQPDDAYDLFLKTWDMDKIDLQEQFRIMLLDRSHHCLGVSTVATGGIALCLVDLKIVFALALKARASSIILAHNHPSGSKLPSKADEDLTTRFMAAGKILDLPVLDHLIVTRDGFMSFANEGKM